MLGGGTVLLGVEATDSSPSGLGEAGPQAELGESPAEPQGGGERRVGRRAPSGFYSVTVSRGVIGVRGSCLGWVQSLTGLLQFPLLRPRLGFRESAACIYERTHAQYSRTGLSSTGPWEGRLWGWRGWEHCLPRGPEAGGPCW